MHSRSPKRYTTHAPVVVVRKWTKDERKKINRDAYKRRHNEGKIVLSITAYSTRAETFAKRHCGLRGDLTDAQISQAITDYINKMGA